MELDLTTMTEEELADHRASLDAGIAELRNAKLAVQAELDRRAEMWLATRAALGQVTHHAVLDVDGIESEEEVPGG